MIKMLKLSPYCFPEQVSSSHLSRDLNAAYADAGIVIENYVPTPTRGVTKEIRQKYKKIKYEERNDGSIIIHRFAMFPEGKNPLQRALRYVCVNVAQYFKGSRAQGIDLIYSASTPPTQGLLCAKVKKKLSKRYGHNVPFVYNLQDIFPDSLVNAKMTRKGSLIWKLGRKIEDYTYRHADRIITISEDFKKNIMDKGVPEEKITVVPNWVNTDDVYPVARENNVLFERYKLDRSLFYICYSGNIGHSQNLDMLLDAAQKLKDELPDVRFVLIGEGAAKESLAQSINERELGNVILLPFQDYSEIAHVFSLGDCGLIISKPGVGGSSVPSKTWSIVAAERPVLASFDKTSELAKLISEAHAGIVADAGDEEQLIDAIHVLYYNIDSRKEMGKNGKKYLSEYASKDKSVKQYLSVITETQQR